MVEPAKPNETLLLFEKTAADKLFDVVPALKFTAVSDVATDAVIVLAFRPKLIPFELLNVKPDARFDVVPAERLMLAWVEATVADAVMVLPARPKLTLLLFEKTAVPEDIEVVPAEMAAGAVDCV
jgi:hypothetical protein